MGPLAKYPAMALRPARHCASVLDCRIFGRGFGDNRPHNSFGAIKLNIVDPHQQIAFTHLVAELQKGIPLVTAGDSARWCIVEWLCAGARSAVAVFLAAFSRPVAASERTTVSLSVPTARQPK